MQKRSDWNRSPSFGRSATLTDVRIISGNFRGRRLRAPDGLSTRPTSDRVREALFNILGAQVAGARFLDLCAGSGAVGLEALSRGAESVVFVEQARRALAFIEENIEHCGVGDATTIVAKEATAALKVLAARDLKFDIVYVDPPYDAGIYKPILSMLNSRKLVEPDGVVIVEYRWRDRLPSEVGDLRRYRDVRHGEATLGFYSVV